MAYFWLWLCIGVSAASTLFLKEATLIVGEAPANSGELGGWAVDLVSNPYALSAMFFFVLSLITYPIALSRLKLSYMFPLYTATQLVLVAVFSLVLFEEGLTWLGWVAIVTICVGIFLVSRPRRDTGESRP